MKPPVVLRIYKGDKLEEVRQFEQQQIVIGRNTDVHLELKDDAVAGIHAMIEDRSGTYYLSDLGSKTGTFKNSEKVLEDKIASGDEIGIGPFKIQFSVGIPKVVPPISGTKETKSAPPPTPTVSASPIAKPEPPPVPKAVTPSVAPAAPAPKKEEEKKPIVAPSAPKFASGKSLPAALGSKHKKNHKTFAPPTAYKDLNEVVKPGKGSNVEVIVAWKDRVISSQHFQKQGSVIIGNDDKVDVVVPILANHTKYELIRIGAVPVIFLSTEMTGEVVRDGDSMTFSELARQNRIRSTGANAELELRQGEMVRIGLQDNTLSIYIRFVPDTPKPMVAPLLDLTSSEVTGVILAGVIAAIFFLFNTVYAPTNLLEDEARLEEPIRKAVVTFTPPRPKEVVEVKEEVAEKKVTVVKEKVRQSTAPSVEKDGAQGKAGEVAPKVTNVKKKELTSARPGGAIKTAPKEGASAKSDKPDPTKVGLLSVFSSKGTQSKLDKAYSGSGELQGMADQATGFAGNSENRDGDTIGTKLKDTGAGGKGTATVGISGIGTQGRGTGTTGYGTGGIGKKGSVDINIGGQDAVVGAGIDKEAIRRVIREHIREIRTCYEKELQHSPDLYGKISIEWDIEDRGRVTRTSVKENALGNNAVANCIMSRLKTWTFPSPPADQVARVVYPFVFTAQ